MHRLSAIAVIAFALLLAAGTPAAAQQEDTDTTITISDLEKILKTQQVSRPSLRHAPSDTSSVTVRRFEQERLTEFKEDTAFRYERETAKKVGWWDRFLYWLDDLLSGLFNTEGKRKGFNRVFYAGAILVIGYTALRMFGFNFNTVFQKKAAGSSIRSELINDNIHEINFEEELKKVIAQRDYHTAIRLYYLLSLKKLSDRNLIAWEINKTNLDYTRELGRTPLRNDFEQITYFFEYVCYGHFDVDAHTFDHALTLFRNFDQKIGK